MAQPTMVGDSGKVNGKVSGRPSKAPNSRVEASTRAGKKTAAHARRGSAVPRRYTEVGNDPFDSVVWERRTSVITNPDGSVVFKMEGAEIPVRLVAARDRHRRLQVLPQGRPPRQERASARPACARSSTGSRAPSAKRARRFGGYFATKKDADTFEAELSFLLVNQYGAFNSPVWFNCGLFHALRHRRAPAATGRWDADADTRRPRPRAPTSARSARPASSSRSATTSWASTTS